MVSITPRLALAELQAAQSQKHVTLNDDLIQLDALVDLYLLGQFVNAPPASPADGDAYLVGGAPAGAWSGYAYKIASCIDGAWRFYTPFNGLRAFVAPSSALIVYLNGTWTAVGSADFATRSGVETLTNKTLGATNVISNSAAALSAVANRNPALALENADSGHAAGNAIAIDFGTDIFPGMASIICRFDNAGYGHGSSLIFATEPASGGLAERMRIDNAGNVGIGTVSPGLVLETAGTNALPSTSGAAANGGLRVGGGGLTNVVLDIGVYGAAPVSWFQVRDRTSYAANYALALNPNGGNVGIGITNPLVGLDVQIATASLPAGSGTTQTGGVLRVGSSNDNSVLDFGNSSAPPYGNWIQSTDRMALGTNYPLLLNPNGGNVGIGTASPRAPLDIAGDVFPHADNAYNLGSASYRFATVYAGTGTINTSGAEAKAAIRPLDEREIAVAMALAKQVRIFQFADAVARKGDAARLHTGMLFEDVVAAFEAEGLDPMRYGIVCRDPALRCETRVTEDRSCQESVPDLDERGMPRYVLGLRYDELMQFVLAGLAARLAALETR